MIHVLARLSYIDHPFSRQMPAARNFAQTSSENLEIFAFCCPQRVFLKEGNDYSKQVVTLAHRVAVEMFLVVVVRLLGYNAPT